MHQQPQEPLLKCIDNLLTLYCEKAEQSRPQFWNIGGPAIAAAPETPPGGAAPAAEQPGSQEVNQQKMDVEVASPTSPSASHK